MEKLPSFERVIGGTQEQKDALLLQAERASLVSGREIFAEYLAIPTREEKESIEKAVQYSNTVSGRYGAYRLFSPERVFLLEPGGVKDFTGGELEQGMCNSFKQLIAVDRSNSTALLAQCVVHEMFHMNSYHASQLVDKKSWLFFKKTEDKPYRSGISMNGREGEGVYFGLAEEAIVSILSKEFFDNVVLQDPLYADEIETTQKIKNWLLAFADAHIKNEAERLKFVTGAKDILLIPDGDRVYEYLTSDRGDAEKMGYFVGYYDEELLSGSLVLERGEEREKFNQVLDRIVSASQGTITGREQLFDEFARAHFTGNYLPLARIVEDVLGKGSFREIAVELGQMKV